VADIFAIGATKSLPAGEHPDLALARIAGGQHGVAARAQLLAAGLTDAQIRHRIAIARLRVEHAGVYALGGRPLTLNGRAMAAVLACGPGAAASHRTAGAVLGLLPVPAGRIEVTMPRPGRRRRGLMIHASRALTDGDVFSSDGVPCTTVARTLLDLAAVLPERQLTRALEKAMILRVFDLGAIEATLARAAGRAGTGTLRRLTKALDDAAPRDRNELERGFLELVRSAGLPEPVVNGLVCGYEVDFHWPLRRLIVETDGRETHDTAIGFERDHQRDLDLELAGWHVIRITWRQLVNGRERIVDLLRARL
jgi:very-short-patch-repair endonuclease